MKKKELNSMIEAMGVKIMSIKEKYQEWRRVQRTKPVYLKVTWMRPNGAGNPVYFASKVKIRFRKVYIYGMGGILLETFKPDRGDTVVLYNFLTQTQKEIA